MADISQQINAINSARYGEEVRGSIVTALTAVNNQVENDTASAGASATAAAASAAQAQAAESNLAAAIAAAEQTEEDIEAAEALRVTAEQGRVDAENARVAAEHARENAETGYVAQAQAAAAQAQQYASSDYVKTAQSWAIGGTSSRYGEDTNNAKYWAEIAAEVVTEGGVGSFNGRTGQVLPEAGDYDSTMVSRGTGTMETALASVESGISSLNSKIAGTDIGVSNASFRTSGDIVVSTAFNEFEFVDIYLTAQGVALPCIRIFPYKSDIYHAITFGYSNPDDNGLRLFAGTFHTAGRYIDSFKLSMSYAAGGAGTVGAWSDVSNSNLLYVRKIIGYNR